MRHQANLPLGIVLERRAVDNRWIRHTWRPIAVIPGAAAHDPREPWTKLAEGEDWCRFHAGTLGLELFRRETEGYRVNLSQAPPRLFVVLRGGADLESEHDVLPFRVTACPYEAQDYLDSGEELVEAVPMPDAVIAFVQAFVEQHHVDEPFHKRQRKRWAAEGNGSRPRFSTPNGPGNGRDDG